MKTGPRVHWWVCCFIRNDNNLAAKIQSSLLVERNGFIYFCNNFELCKQYFCILPPQNNIFRENRENSPREHWWVCSFIRMNDNLVPKIHSSLLVKINRFVHFSNDYELHDQYFHILPPQNNMFIENIENRPQRTLMSMLLHQDEW